jgi:hypothetical protein
LQIKKTLIKLVKFMNLVSAVDENWILEKLLLQDLCSKIGRWWDLSIASPLRRFAVPPALAMPAPSAATERLAAHWVADALAADETIDFSVTKGKPHPLFSLFATSVLLQSFILSPRVPGAPPALVGVSSEYIVGAPDAVRERVALRCLQELAAFAVADDCGAAAVVEAPSGMLRVDAARSCEDLLVELTGKVFTSYAIICILVAGRSDFLFTYTPVVK